MEHLHNRDEHIHHMELLAHKLLLIGRVLRLGSENAVDHFCGDEDRRFLKEVKNRDPHEVKEELLLEMQHRIDRHQYPAFGF